MAASKGEAIIDALIAKIQAISSPSFTVRTMPAHPSRCDSLPVVFVWLMNAKPIGAADNNVRSNFTIGITAVDRGLADSDVMASVDQLREKIQNAIDADITIGGTCEQANITDWEYEYESPDETSMRVAAKATLIAKQKIVRQAN